MKIILASSSPRRKELLLQIGLTFETVVPGTGEQADPLHSPSEMVLEIAERKAADALKLVRGDALIISADTAVYLDGEILGKPETRDEAFNMLSRLQGKRHRVYTGVCLYRHTKHPLMKSFTEYADVFMREMSPEEITAYIDTGEPMDKAGSYGLQGRGAVYVRRVEGDYSTVVGLPLCALWREMREMLYE
jgi:septum formation protein